MEDDPMPSNESARGIMKRAVLVACAVGITLVAAPAFAAWTPAVGTTLDDIVRMEEARAARTNAVPSTVPSNGVYIEEQWIVEPPRVNEPLMVEAAALQAADRYGRPRDQGAPPVALLARVTVPGTTPIVGLDIPFRTIVDRQAWVVTYTSAEPVQVGSEKAGASSASDPPPLMVTHYSVLLDADTGEFLMGFYTP
jgi:hypothetical protein